MFVEGRYWRLVQNVLFPVVFLSMGMIKDAFWYHFLKFFPLFSIFLFVLLAIDSMKNQLIESPSLPYNEKRMVTPVGNLKLPSISKYCMKNKEQVTKWVSNVGFPQGKMTGEKCSTIITELIKRTLFITFERFPDNCPWLGLGFWFF